MIDSLINKKQYTSEQIDSINNMFDTYVDAYYVNYDTVNKSANLIYLQHNDEWKKWEPKGKTNIELTNEKQSQKHYECEYDNEFKAIAFMFIIFIHILRILK